MQAIKDKNYRVIGYYDDIGDKIYIKNAQYKVLGVYEKKTDRTLDANYRFVGLGNQLLRLLDVR
jgi:hypothetical protein